MKLKHMLKALITRNGKFGDTFLIESSFEITSLFKQKVAVEIWNDEMPEVFI